MQEIISNQEIIIRLFLSVLFAFAIGLEREFKHQPAGLRTHILIGLGSCMLMILSILVPEMYNSNINDP
jgi:putative Mg2+ transporter-C (MgtC) family protein